MGSERSDASLIVDSLSDADAFGEIFDRHCDAISRFLRRRVAAETADELTAETFLIALRERASFDTQRRSARPWLFGIATNLLSHDRRSEVRRLRAYRLLDRPQEPDFSDEAVARSDAEAMQAQVAAALEGLADGDRDVLLLIAWGELSYAEVAEALEIPLGTVRSRLARARQQITARLGEPDEETEGVSTGG